MPVKGARARSRAVASGALVFALLAMTAVACTSDDDDGGGGGGAAAAASPTEVAQEDATAGGDPAGGGDNAVVNGSPADISEAPWTAALADRATASQFCGGVLVDATQVWTAAHCVTEPDTTDIIDPDGVAVILGRTDLRDDSGELIAIDEILVSDQWDPARTDHDFAALILATPSRSQPIAVPTLDSTTLWDAGSPALLVGWGCTAGREGGCNAAPTLQQANLTVASEEGCSRGAQGGFDASAMLCTTGGRGGAQACFGDSGGPLTALADDNTRFLIGIVSFGVTDCEPGSPAFFALAAAFPGDSYNSRASGSQGG